MEFCDIQLGYFRIILVSPISCSVVLPFHLPDHGFWGQWNFSLCDSRLRKFCIFKLRTLFSKQNNKSRPEIPGIRSRVQVRVHGELCRMFSEFDTVELTRFSDLSWQISERRTLDISTDMIRLNLKFFVMTVLGRWSLPHIIRLVVGTVLGSCLEWCLSPVVGLSQVAVSINVGFWWQTPPPPHSGWVVGLELFAPFLFFFFFLPPLILFSINRRYPVEICPTD